MIISMLKMEWGYVEDFMDYQSLKVYDLYSKDDIQTFYKNYKEEITNEIYDAIVVMMKENLLQIPVFKFNIGGRIARISVTRDNIDIILKECIATYEETENYERCSQALKLINNQIEDTGLIH